MIKEKFSKSNISETNIRGLYINKRRLEIIFLIISYLFIFNLIYIYQIALSFAYEGFVFKYPGTMWSVIFSIISIIPCFLLPINFIKPSVLVSWMLYLIVYIPACYIPLYTIDINKYALLLNILVIMFSLFIIAFVYKLPYLKINSLKLKRSYIFIFIFIFVIITCVLLYFKCKELIGFVSIFHVYEKRKILTNILGLSSRGIYGYLIFWLSKVIFPFCLAYGIVFRRNFLIILGCLGLLFLYAIDPFKSILATIFYIPLAYLYLRYSNVRKVIPRLIILIILFILFCNVFDKIYGKLLLTHLLVRRMLIMPGLLTGWYWQFFSSHSHVYLADSIFRLFIAYSYNHQPPYEVAYYFLGKYIDANANFWASAYADFGNLGMLIYSLILALYLWVYDSISKKFGIVLPSVILMLASFGLANSALLTNLFSGGLLFLLLLLYVIKPKVEEKIE